MRCRNFDLALTILVVAAAVAAQKELLRVGSGSFHFLAALCQRKENLSERQKRMDAASKDLMAIAQAKLGHIQSKGNSQTWKNWYRMATSLP